MAATTGRPNDENAIAGYVRGLSQAKRAFQALPDIVREQMLDATETTVRQIARGAQARLMASPSIQTRNLYNSIAWRVTKTNGRGRVGVTTGSTTIANLATRKVHKVRGIVMQSGGVQRIDKPSRRAHFVEFGTRYMRAEPFMLPAAEAEKANYLARAIRAGKAIETSMAGIGGRFD